MELQDLLSVEAEKRDANWEDRFLTALTEGRLRLVTPDPQVGPDGWPYLLAELTPNGPEPAQRVLQWLSERGIGLVVNPEKDYPDFVLSYGMIWSFRETGLFFRRDVNPPDGQFEITLESIAHAGTPTPQFLPNYVRAILKQFFTDQGVFDPRILVISQDRVNYELAFSLESLGNPPQSEHAGIAEAISWFLPPHYSLVLISEKGLPPFGPLEPAREG